MGLIENRDAQFMLLAGFIIGVGLVITTIMLNSIIFESNMAIEDGSEISKNELLGIVQITRDETRSAYINATNSTGTNNDNIANFSKQVKSFIGNLSRISSLHGESVNLSWDLEKWNKNQYANFTENGMAMGAANWTLVEGVRNTTIFEFNNVNVTDYFLIVVTNSSGSLWSMNITGSINVINKTGGSTNYIFNNYINVLNSTYGFNTSTFNEIYAINFIHGSNSWGRFAMEGKNTQYSTYFTRSRDYILNSTITFSTSRVRANITIPVSVPR